MSFSTARLNSKLTFEIFADRTLHDELIGSFSDTVASFSGTGTSMCLLVYLWSSPLPTETSFERNLVPLSEATILFSVKISEADPQDVLHQLLENTHINIEPLTTPNPDSLLEDAASAMDTTQSVVEDWSPLLDKLQIFCKIMDGVAEVHRNADSAMTQNW